MNNEIYQSYGLQSKELIKIGNYDGFWIRNKVYLLVPINGMEEETLGELKKLSDFMVQQGDANVASFVPTLEGYYVSTLKEIEYILLRCARQTVRQEEPEGRNLATFHGIGKYFPETIEEISRIGQWKELWEKRLEQLEKFWQAKAMNHPNNSFDSLFIKSFPYYLGLTENAIQYLVDTELDDEPKSFDGATICHEKYTSKVWKYYYRIKIPFQWVYDHPSRDLAEWVRHQWLTKKEDSEQEIMDFFNEYEKVSPLSSFAWRLMYARLLFPLHYFELIEEHYVTTDDKKKEEQERLLREMMEQSTEHEAFLRGFYNMISLPAERLGIKRVDWFT